MDDYSKSAESSYAAIAKRRERERKVLIDNALDKRTEAEFITAIRETLGITRDHPGYLAAIKFWRSQHP
jgi:hypothetical protein